MARRGARVLDEPQSGSAADAWREAVARSREDAERGMSGPPPAWEPEVWEEEAPAPARSSRTPTRAAPEDVRPPRRASRRVENRPAPAAAAEPVRKPRKVAPQAAAELAAAVGNRRAPRLEERLGEAARAYERDRYQDALRMLKPLVESAPGSPAVRELHGLILYRLGRWRAAIGELDAFRAMTGSYDQHPVLEDCHRALAQWKAVEELWEDLRRASPGAELVAEGRIVAAGALADRGDLRGAIKLLETATPKTRSPRLHHLRLWYALADLYERAGEIPKARELFRQVLRHDATFVDVPERLAALD